MKYLDFDLQFRRDGNKYKAVVVRSPAGEAYGSFALPPGDAKLTELLQNDGVPRRGSLDFQIPDSTVARSVGTQLYDAVFTGEIETALRMSLGEAKNQGTGLRIRLRMSEAPELVILPWEFLYSSRSQSFLALKTETPVVRYVELPEIIEPLSVKPPLRVLVVTCSPNDAPKLDVEDESRRLMEATRRPRERGSLVVEVLHHATWKSLQKRLQESSVHILHFIGHGDFDKSSQSGVLLFEDESGASRSISGESVSVLLGNHPAIRLVVLNACKGALTSTKEPFAGISQHLLRRGVPAAIAMQFAITDLAARLFAESFYGAVANGYPLDAALVEARTALFLDELSAEWATPVLFMRAPDGRIFDVQSHPRFSLVKMVVALSVLAVLAVSSIAIWRYLHPVLKVPRLAVIGPVNNSQLAKYDYLSTAIGDVLSLELADSDKINPIPREDIAEAEQDVQIHADECTLDEHRPPLQEVLGASYLVFGQFKQPDDPERKGQVRVFLCLENAAGKRLHSWDGYTNDDQAHMFAAVAANEFRQYLGPHPPSAQDYQNIFPSKTEARRLYFQGLANLRTFDARTAQETLQEAASIENESPLIHAALSDAWSMLRHDEQAAREAKRALELLSGLTSYPLDYGLALKARAEETAHDWDSAIGDYGQLYGAHRERLDYGLKLANVQVRGAKLDEALTTINRLEGLGAPLGGDPRIQIVKSRAFQARADYKNAADSAERALQLATRENARIMQADALLELCWVHIKHGDSSEITNSCEKAKENFSVYGDEVSAAVALNAEANWLGEQGRYKDAKERFQQVVAINRKYGAQRDLAGALLNLANISIQQNRRDEAEPLLLESLQISRSIHEISDQANALINLSEVHRERGDFLASKHDATEALSISHDIGNPSIEALALSSLADNEAETGGLTDALAKYNQILAIRKKLNERSKIATTLTRIAGIYFRMGDLEKAGQNYSTALQTYQQLNQSDNAAQTSLSLAEIAFELGHLSEAEAEGRRLAKSFEGLQDDVSQKDALALLVRVLVAEGSEKLADARGQVSLMKSLPKMDPDAQVEPDPDVELDAALAEGVFLTAVGTGSEGYRLLDTAKASAEGSGRIYSAYELWIAAIDAKGKSDGPKAVGAELAKLRSSSSKLGFNLITHKADNLFRVRNL
jgi:tetratricopeptide (TPR) repeat protein